MNKGMYSQSVQANIQAANYLKKTKKGKRFVATVYNNAGIAYNAMGKLEQANKCYHLAIRSITENPDAIISMATVYCNLSSQLQDNERSLYYLNKADSVASKEGDKAILGIVILNKARIYEGTQQWQQCKSHLMHALTLGTSEQDTMLQYRALNKLASLSLMTGDAHHALSYLEKARSLNPAGDESPFQENANKYLYGEVYFSLKQYAKAEEALLIALNAARQMGLKDQTAEAHYKLSEVYEAMNIYRKAFVHQRAYIQYKDSVINKAITADIHQMEIKYRTAEKDRLILQQQRSAERKNLLLGGIVAAALMFIGILTALYRQTKQKQKIIIQQREIAQLKAMMEGEEKERNRIAGELHDGIGCMLATVKVHLNSMKKVPTPEKVEEMMVMIDDIATEVRQTSHNLIPRALTMHSLEEVLLLYCEGINNKESGLHIELHINGDLPVLSKQSEMIIYRTVQELVQNVIKHANATIADVQISVLQGKINIIVEDNGTGFDPGKMSSGMGLSNLQYKVQALQGFMSINAAKGKNTTVYIEFDLEKLKLAV